MAQLVTIRQNANNCMSQPHSMRSILQAGAATAIGMSTGCVVSTIMFENKLAQNYAPILILTACITLFSSFICFINIFSESHPTRTYTVVV